MRQVRCPHNARAAPLTRFATPATKVSTNDMLQQLVMPGVGWWHAPNVELSRASPSAPRTLTRSPKAGGADASSDASMGSRPAVHGLIGMNGLQSSRSTRHLGPELRGSWKSSTAACFSGLANCITTGGAGGGEERGVRSPAEALLLGVANDRPSGEAPHVVGDGTLRALRLSY